MNHMECGDCSRWMQDKDYKHLGACNLLRAWVQTIRLDAQGKVEITATLGMPGMEAKNLRTKRDFGCVHWEKK